VVDGGVEEGDVNGDTVGGCLWRRGGRLSMAEERGDSSGEEGDVDSSGGKGDVDGGAEGGRR
jgi:hypothetical protein